ncbi:MAG: type III pantothenate kinase, partial [Albidovulum sp.]|nr:type III pantothenate kinase [Albidovulum sp.]
MQLAIDVGNTNTVFAVVDERDIVCKWRCATDSDRTGDEYFVWLSALMRSAKIEAEISDVVVASVVPRVVL